MTNIPHIINRYARQVSLPALGIKGQQQLLAASVLVIGAGGLGCPALLYLAAAGVGRIGIVDHDTVALHNLHRQVLYTMNDIGQPKAAAACLHLQARNPDVNVNAYTERLDLALAEVLFPQYDIVIDATDNFETRYLINDTCAALHKPFIYGSIQQTEGQVAVFCMDAGESPAANYRDLFPEQMAAGVVPDCETGGVLGVLPGIIGTMQASEAIKIITGIGTSLRNQVLTYNLLNHQTYIFQCNSSIIQ